MTGCATDIRKDYMTQTVNELIEKKLWKLQ